MFPKTILKCWSTIVIVGESKLEKTHVHVSQKKVTTLISRKKALHHFLISLSKNLLFHYSNQLHMKDMERSIICCHMNCNAPTQFLTRSGYQKKHKVTHLSCNDSGSGITCKCFGGILFEKSVQCIQSLIILLFLILL